MAGLRKAVMVVVAAATIVTVSGSTGPAFMWGSTSHMSCKETGKASRVVYEVKDKDYWGNDFLTTLLEPETKPDVVTVFLGNKLRTEHLARLSDEEQLQPLQKALASAVSSLSVPHVDYSGSDAPLMDSLSAVAHSAEADLRTVGTCGGALTKGDLSQAVQQLPGNKTGVMLVCAQVTDDLQQEMELLEELTGALEAAEKQHIIMYMSEPAMQRVTPRKLQEKVEKKCNSECMAVVYAVEAAIILLIVLVAVILGMACHNMLDAPSKFETPKQDQ